MFCLLPKMADAFKQKILSGEVDPIKLSEMTSKERRAELAKHFGEDVAKDLNASLESKLILKNVQLGMVNWAKQALGEKTRAGQDLISKIERMDERILDPATREAFLGDLASSKLGVEVTFDEAKNIAVVTKKMNEARAKIVPGSPMGSAERLEYGSYKRALENYVNELKLSNKDTSIKAIVKENLNPLTAAQNIGGMAKGIWSSFDNSAIGRQGLKILIDNPKIWAERAFKSFGDIVETVKDGPEMNKVVDGLMADIYSRDNAINGNYKKAKLDIGEMEEAYPSTLQEKIPVLGRLFKASEVAYTSFLRGARADMFDMLIKEAESKQIPLDKATLEGIGQFVNSTTGRGSLGKFEAAGKAINNIFFSAKKIRSDFDFLTGFQGNEAIPTHLKWRAAGNLAKTGVGLASIMAIANALKPGTAETDPRSSNFGKLKFGNTTVDMTAGMGGIITLLARIATSSTKSANTGKVTEINTGKFGTSTTDEVVGRWFRNKLSPFLSIGLDIAKGTDFSGQPITVKGMAKNLITPLPIKNLEGIYSDPKTSDTTKFVISLVELLGLGSNVLTPPKESSKANKPTKH